MSRSFQIVEFKVAESDFFLKKLQESTFDWQLFEARNYSSAFLSATRSITFAIQACMSDVDGFDQWYAKKQDSLKENKLAKYFLTARNLSQKVGYYPIINGRMYFDEHGNRRVNYVFEDVGESDLKEYPENDVLSACKEHLTNILQIVLDCYLDFGSIVTPEGYFSFENLEQMGKKLEDLEEELGYPRGWTDIPHATNEQRLQALRRDIPYYGIDHILIEYLGKNRFGETEDS